MQLGDGPNGVLFGIILILTYVALILVERDFAAYLLPELVLMEFLPQLEVERYSTLGDASISIDSVLHNWILVYGI